MSHIEKQKSILHMDGDAFFVGVEVAKNPKLRGLPVVTGEERGIVTAQSYEAKALGIKRGMPIYRVKKDFPSVIVLAGDYKSYVKYSQQMFDIVRRYADDVEEYSIDECFADLTGLDKPLKMTYKEIAERIKREINNEMDLSISIGVAPTKVLAKVASKWVKPNGLTIITTDTVREFLLETKIENIWGIGPSTANLLQQKGVYTALDFYNKDIAWVQKNLNSPYESIWQELHSIYVMELNPITKTEYSSIQKTRTFHPKTNDRTFLLSQLSKHIEDACLKARYYDLTPKKLFIYLKTEHFKYITVKINLPSPTNTPETLTAVLFKHFDEIYRKGILYRTTGVTLSDLTQGYVLQTDLFGETEKVNKFQELHKQIDSLENKFGKHIVYLAGSQSARKRNVKGTESEDLDRNLLFL